MTECVEIIIIYFMQYLLSFSLRMFLILYVIMQMIYTNKIRGKGHLLLTKTIFMYIKVASNSIQYELIHIP